MKNVVEICANCGKIKKEKKKEFVCGECKSNVAVVVPYSIFKQMVDSGAAKE